MAVCRLLHFFFCSIGNTSILLWNMKMLHVRTLNAISVKPSHLYTYLHSGGLAERLNRLQCRQRSAVSFWRHQSLSDASAIRGDLHKSTTSLTKYRFLLTLPLNHHSLTLIMNRFVRLLSWQDSFFFFFFVCDFMETQRSGSDHWLRTVRSICRWQETACLGLLFSFFLFSSLWWTKPLVFSCCYMSPYNRTPAGA